ncbi:MAG: hypothetical protein WBE18_01795 [Gammaproteobacteria bacterium]
MKVKCMNIYDVRTRRYKNTSRSLTIDKEYLVLEIIISAVNGSVYRLISENKNSIPRLHNALQFQIVSDLIPPNWEMNIVNNKLIILGPKIWTKNEFWDAYYDGNPIIKEIYKRETKIICEHENL